MKLLTPQSTLDDLTQVIAPHIPGSEATIRKDEHATAELSHEVTRHHSSFLQTSHKTKVLVWQVKWSRFSPFFQEQVQHTATVFQAADASLTHGEGDVYYRQYIVNGDISTEETNALADLVARGITVITAAEGTTVNI